MIEAAPAAAPITISVEGVSKSFKTQKALENISLKFADSFLHGVIGPEGAGKTTLMRIVLGLLRPDRGQVKFFREGEQTDFEVLRPLIAYMPQQQSLYPDLSVDEHLEFFRDLYTISEADYRARRDELLQVTRLGDFVDRSAAQLSGGMYKKLGLMCALLRSPRAVILDEPTNGVDPISRREFWELLYKLVDQKILIVVTTAYMDEAERCSQVHLMENGQVIAEGEPRDLLRKQKVRSFDELFMKQSSSDEPAQESAHE